MTLFQKEKLHLLSLSHHLASIVTVMPSSRVTLQIKIYLGEIDILELMKVTEILNDIPLHV